MSSIVTATANQIRDLSLSSVEKGERQAAKRGWEVVRLASIALAAIALIHLIVSPSRAALVIAGIIVVIAHEAYRVAENCLEVLNNAQIEMAIRINEQAGLYQISKNTLLVGPILRIIYAD